MGFNTAAGMTEPLTTSNPVKINIDATATGKVIVPPNIPGHVGIGFCMGAFLQNIGAKTVYLGVDVTLTAAVRFADLKAGDTIWLPAEICNQGIRGICGAGDSSDVTRVYAHGL